jgi:predicted dehydrogenase
LEAICDLDLKRAQDFCHNFGYARAYDDFHRMIEEIQPELIYCMVQPNATAGLLEQLLPLEIPIFTEKPPGVTVAEAERLAALAEQYQVINYVAFNRRAMPGLQRLKQWVAENGPIRYARAEMLRNRRLEADFAIGTAIHPLDCLRYLCGEVVRIEARTLPYASTPARDFLVRLLFLNGIAADLAVLVDCGLTREQYLVHVGNQMMEVALGTAYACSFCYSGERAYKDNSVLFDDPAITDPLIAGGFVGEHEAFLEAVTTGKLPSCCLQDARQVLYCV